jgi:hypothetical protein
MATTCGAIRWRSAGPANVLAKAGPGIRFNEHIEGDGPTVFARTISEACDYMTDMGRKRDGGAAQLLAASLPLRSHIRFASKDGVIGLPACR